MEKQDEEEDIPKGKKGNEESPDQIGRYPSLISSQLLRISRFLFWFPRDSTHSVFYLLDFFMQILIFIFIFICPKEKQSQQS